MDDQSEEQKRVSFGGAVSLILMALFFDVMLVIVWTMSLMISLGANAISLMLEYAPRLIPGLGAVAGYIVGSVVGEGAEKVGEALGVALYLGMVLSVNTLAILSFFTAFSTSDSPYLHRRAFFLPLRAFICSGLPTWTIVTVWSLIRAKAHDAALHRQYNTKMKSRGRGRARPEETPEGEEAYASQNSLAYE